MSVNIQFMAHTRSVSFDYAWLYCHEDKALQSELGRFVIAWLSNNQLDSLPPVSAFFLRQNKCVLFSGRKSSTRRDKTEREIFERALFVWDVQEEIRYLHLEPLRRRLEQAARDVFASVPNDQIRAPRSTKPLSFEIEDLDLEAEREREAEDDWELPLELQWAEVIAAGLTVEVPASWPFRRLLAPLRDSPIYAGEAISIGCAVPLKQLNGIGGPWIFSGPDSDDDSLPKVRTPSGNILGEVETRRIRSSWEEGARKQTQLAEKVQLAKCTNTEIAPQLDTEALAEFQEVAALSRQLEIQGDVHWGMRLLRRSPRNSIVTSVKRLYFLMAPTSRLIGLDGRTSWHMLLFEILLFHDTATAEMIGDWLDRLTRLKQLTANWPVKVPPDWLRQLEESYSSLRNLLVSRAGRSEAI